MSDEDVVDVPNGAPDKPIGRKEWSEMCTGGGRWPLFAPSDGLCYSCNADLIAHYNKTGRFSSTGCPICHYSFVE